MYDVCFGLNRRPFASVPQIDQYFPAVAIEGARTSLTRCIQRGEGAGLVIGPSGTGKTLLCLLLAEQFKRSFQVVMLSSGRLSTRRALFQAILYELGRPYRGMDEGELRLALVDYLTTGEGSEHGMLLIVDEAHTLPLRLLEEIRLLTNLVQNNQPLVRLVLAGAPLLEERFASPRLDSFSQRLTARCYLEAFNQSETQSYIRSQISAAGGRSEYVFSDEACQTVFQATGGVPRLINNVCDHALLLGYVAGRQRIEPSDIEEAWSDLQQLPTPWSGESKSDSEKEGVIEFGALDEPNVAPTLRISTADEEHDAEFAEPVEQICRIEQLLAEVEDDFVPAGTIGPEVEMCFDAGSHPFQEKFEQEEVVSERYGATPATSTATQAYESKTIVSEQPVAAGVETVCFDLSDLTMPAFEYEEATAASASAPAQEVPIARPSVPQPAATGAPVGPHREYRRLFAQLRRG